MTRTITFRIMYEGKTMDTCEHDDQERSPTHDHCACMGLCDRPTSIEARLAAIINRDVILQHFIIMNPAAKGAMMHVPEIYFQRTDPARRQFRHPRMPPAP